MKEQTEIPKYATLLYEVRRELNISWLEYVYLDMVYHLSHEGWCYKSLAQCGEDLGIDRSNLFRMRQKLIKRGLLIKNRKGHVKTSVTYAKRLQLAKQPLSKRNKLLSFRDSAVVKTQPKNNNRITKNLESIKIAQEDHRGKPSPAKEALREKIKRGEL